jgi:hypothetical protein
MLIAPHLSGPALVATVGSISTYSAIESYSSRKQAGQTEREARRGAFGAATGFNFLFNLMGFDYGTLEKASQEEVEDAWSTVIGGFAGGWIAKNLIAPATEIVASGQTNNISDEVINATKGKKPTQLHHYATNKSKTYTPRMKKIANKYGLDLDELWNKGKLPHLGRHPNLYHDFVQRNMERAAREAGGDTRKFIELFEKYVIKPVKKIQSY